MRFITWQRQLIGLPNDLSVYWQQYPWPFGESLCKIRALASEMSSYTSVLTIVAFTMERYIAICHPLYSYTMSSLARVLKIIVAAWLVSLMCALPFAVFTTVNYIDYPPYSGNILEESAFCAMLEANIPEWLPIYELSTLMFLIIPIIIIVILYTKIAIKLRERNDYSLGTRVGGSVHSRKRHSKSTKPIIRMLVAVVSMFFICWAPFHAQRLIYLYGKSWPNYVTLNEWMYYITGALYFFSSTVNPILYNLMSVKYRKAFKQTLFGGQNVNKRGHQSSFRESSQGAAEISEDTQKNTNKCTPCEKVKSDTIVRVNNSNVTNGNCVLTVKTGFFPKNLFILPPNPLANKEQGINPQKVGTPPLFISNCNTAKETYI
ncbi:unnamed protein product [Nezara viridula]|uniref:G-protein coupled receptors family 1 profile domain-containing protein n=1 Tax=Nezara viridula TaxID=85310 RepID=A0A9P0ECH5_NEZVI|nr:unnamed protein product [Nezara viridula]